MTMQDDGKRRESGRAGQGRAGQCSGLSSEAAKETWRRMGSITETGEYEIRTGQVRFWERAWKRRFRPKWRAREKKERRF